MASLSVNIHQLKLKNPVMTASGTFGYGLEFADFVPLEEIGTRKSADITRKFRFLCL